MPFLVGLVHVDKIDSIWPAHTADFRVNIGVLLEVLAEHLLDVFKCEVGAQVYRCGRTPQIMHHHPLELVAELQLVLQLGDLLDGVHTDRIV